MKTMVRAAGWVATAGLLGAAMVLPAAALANDRYPSSVAPVPTQTATPTWAPTPTLAPTPTTPGLENTPTPAPTATPVVTPTPSGTVDAATGTPRITPPPTDVTGSNGSSGTGSGWGLAMLALGGLALTTLLLRPASRRSRR